MNLTERDLSAFLQEVFQHLHENPEVSWQEYETTNYIKRLLEKENCRVKTFDDIPGVIVEIGEGNPVIGLRADMDALWQEVDGKFQANHSCGHDAHMTIVLGTIFTILREGLPEQGTFRFIFQPAEEKGTGALALIEKGVVDGLDFLYGLHLRPIQELRNGQFTPAINHGAAKFIKGTIVGEDAHGARPHLNANAILVGTEFFQLINNLHIDPMIPHSVKMTSFQAGGESSNIIPGNATFSLDMRAQTNEAIETLTAKVQQISRMLAEYHGVEIHIEQVSNVAAAVINEEAMSLMEEAIIDTVGKDKLFPMITSTGGEDFHFYAIKRPELKTTMLGVGCDLKPGLHHPAMTFNHAAIEDAVRILSRALRITAEKNS